MPEGHQDQQPVADRVAAVGSSSDQLVDLGLRQVLALPVIGVLADHHELSTFQIVRAVIGQPYSLANFPLEQINCRHNVYIADSL
jgi:hypothetical protein